MLVHAPNSLRRVSPLFPSVGLTLWEIAARARPYAGKSEMRVVRMVMKGKHDAIPGDTPASLASAIEQAWAFDTHERPTARALGAMLCRDEGGDGGEGPSTNVDG